MSGSSILGRRSRVISDDRPMRDCRDAATDGDILISRGEVRDDWPLGNRDRAACRSLCATGASGMSHYSSGSRLTVRIDSAECLTITSVKTDIEAFTPAAASCANVNESRSLRLYPIDLPRFGATSYRRLLGALDDKIELNRRTEPHARGLGGGAVQVLVRGLRSRRGETRREDAGRRAGRGNRSLSEPLRGVRARPDSAGLARCSARFGG